MGSEMKGLLSPYRILDLTDERGIFCSKILADLGADVIKIEPTSGCTARKLEPFCEGSAQPETSLFWTAYNGNKKGITLNLEFEEGREIFRKLAASADMVIEDFAPGHMVALGLGYPDLCKISPDIILTSITPFGQEGPYRDFQASDLTCWSMGGFANLTGDSDRAPVQISFPQAYLTGANEAAVATMVALYYREISGEGQHVDVSIQASVAKNMMNAPLFWEAAAINLHRAGPFRVGLSLASGQRVIWKCKDGEVAFFFWGGKTGVRTNTALVEYMDEEGMAPEFMKEMDWASFDSATAGDELFGKLSHYVSKFFLSHTKEELFKEGIKRKMTLYPVQDAADIVEDPQLKDRAFWTDIELPESGCKVPYLGPPALFSEEVKIKQKRAPLLGEHNSEIYLDELGLSRAELIKLKELGAI